jgi:hypothetical protein
MFVLIALIAAALAWCVGRGLFARTGLPTRDILYADVGSTFPQPAPLTSKRYRLSGKPDYLVRVKDGIAPVELKSSRSPSSGRPYDGHLFHWRPTVYSSKTFIVSRSRTDWSNTRIAPSVSSIRLRYAQACLPSLTKSKRPNAVGNATSTTINLANAGLAVRSVCGEGLI